MLENWEFYCTIYHKERNEVIGKAYYCSKTHRYKLDIIRNGDKFLTTHFFKELDLNDFILHKLLKVWGRRLNV